MRTRAQRRAINERATRHARVVVCQCFNCRDVASDLVPRLRDNLKKCGKRCCNNPRKHGDGPNWKEAFAVSVADAAIREFTEA